MYLQSYTRIISIRFSSCVMARPTRGLALSSRASLLLGDEVEGKGGDGVHFCLSNPASDTPHGHKNTSQYLERDSGPDVV